MPRPAAGCSTAGRPAEARGNLREIVGVTDRIGAITQALRGFARRGAGELRPIAVEEALDGALTLLAGRIRDAGVTIVRDPRAPGRRGDSPAASGSSRSSSTSCRTRSTRCASAADPTITIRVSPRRRHRHDHRRRQRAGGARRRCATSSSCPSPPPRRPASASASSSPATSPASSAARSGSSRPTGRGAAFTLELPRAA